VQGQQQNGAQQQPTVNPQQLAHKSNTVEKRTNTLW
jgi:hypothetical protein